MAVHPLPPELRGRVFDRSEALAAGISPRMLEGSRLVRIHTAIYRYADTDMTYDLHVEAARRVAPSDAALSHVSNLRWRGLVVSPEEPVHLSSNSSTHVERTGMVIHRRQGQLHARLLRGVPVLGPDRTFVDCGTQLGLRTLVATGDWLVAQGDTDLHTLRAYVMASHLDGVVKARDAVAMVREGSESFRESELRWELVRAGLPEPDLNVDIVDGFGRFVARGDLVLWEWKVLVEYDGWHHERDAVQRQRDHLRREALDAAGWRVIVVTSADMRRTGEIAWRVFGALRQCGYRGPRPRIGR